MITTVLVYTAAKSIPVDVAALQFLARRMGTRMRQPSADGAGPPAWGLRAVLT